MRPRCPLPTAWPRLRGATWAFVLLAGSCLNPHPDPFPQTMDSPSPAASAPENASVAVNANPSDQAPQSGQPAPSPMLEGGVPATPAAPAPMTPSFGNEGADAGAPPSFDAGLPPDASPL